MYHSSCLLLSSALHSKRQLSCRRAQDLPLLKKFIEMCTFLASVFKAETIPHSSPEIPAWASNFWAAQQASVTPFCIFQPRNAKEVVVVVLVSRKLGCSFAVKSGGHAAFAGASNVDGGITIDLARLDAIEITDDKKIAKVGAGNTWYRVYTSLEADQLAVIGGRVADIGVGGFTLGGGISFFSGSHGWGCDNVANYELVTAAGSILQVNQKFYPDLYWALRGGGSNVGVVTRFDLETFPQGSIWGGSRVYNATTYGSDLIKAFVDFGNNPDEHAATWLSFVKFQGATVMSILLMHATPAPNPPVFNAYKAIPSLTDTTKIRTLADLTLETNASNPKGRRQSYWMHTFKFNVQLIEFMTETYLEEVVPVESVSGLEYPLVLQFITKETLVKMQRNGGNATPLPKNADDGPFLIMQLCPMWLAQQDDEAVIGSIVGILDKVVGRAKETGMYRDADQEADMNYGSDYQDVLGSYGEDNYERLEKIAKRHDPMGVFQTLNKGYFKFGGPPKGSST
ncbi:FAD binding domain-containing protein [Mytilinidion resinicola]|uniref:FAD binding domain-containing protein n=1 Tax=Mytilinidion resinicola TaxID=574789 RepID=A0A6A6XYE2_9PEZI|nr:FAD binding domain-containing protein [Mytilinidion resinicola]KAF2801283.1 FAD binding domain-containing protein [Mytilinidion resinicola]